MNYGEEWMSMAEDYLIKVVSGKDERSKEVRAIRKKLSVHLANASDDDLKIMMEVHNRRNPNMHKSLKDMKELRKHHQAKQKNKKRW